MEDPGAMRMGQLALLTKEKINCVPVCLHNRLSLSFMSGSRPFFPVSTSTLTPFLFRVFPLLGPPT